MLGSCAQFVTMHLKCEADLLFFKGGEEAHGASHQLWPRVLQLWRRALLRQCHQGDET